MNTHGVLPPVVVLPLALLAGLVIVAHLAALHAAPDVPVSRRRLRTAAGIVMLTTTLVLAYAFAFVGTGDPARFATVWTAAILLLLVVLTLAGLDALNNVRLARIHRRRIRREAGGLHARIAEALTRAARETPADHDRPAHPRRDRSNDP
jgi:hypothetical protein